MKFRLGHDHRCEINAAKLGRELGGKPVETFDIGIKKTLQWYLDIQERMRGLSMLFSDQKTPN